MGGTGFLGLKGVFAEETCGFLLPARRFFLLGNKIEGGTLLDGGLRNDDGNECGG